MRQGNLGGASPGRTAIVVCAGVGDNTNGQAAARTMQGLVKHGGFSSATQRIGAYPSGREQTQDLYGYTLTAPDGSEVDLYEFWWADLSRFPAAMRLYLVALYGLVLQLPATGIAALRGGGPLTAAPAADGETPWSVRPIAFLEWLLAVPLVLVSVLEAALVGGFAAVEWTDAQFTNPSEALGVAVLALYAGVVFGVGWWRLGRYQRDRGRFGAVVVGCVLFVAAVIATGVGADADGGLPAGLADALLVLVAFVVRPIWIGIGAAMLGLLGTLIWRDLWRRPRESYTALSAVTTSTAGFALLTGALLAASGAAVRTLGSQWDATTGTPSCLADGNSWWPSACAPNVPTQPWDWGVNLYTLLLSPLVWVGVLAAAVALFTAVITAAPAFRGVPRWPVRAAPATTRAGVETIERRIEDRPMRIVLATALTASGILIIVSWLPYVGFASRQQVPRVSALLGTLVLALVALTRALNITTSALRKSSPGNEATRRMLDKAYDVATFLREPARPSPGTVDPQPSPRQNILHRYEALLEHLLVTGPAGRRYTHVVFFAHSQGSVLTATLLADPLPAATSVDVVTFGCPLRQLYLRRFPSQFAWVDRLRTDPHDFVQGIRSWTNVTGSADPVGGPLFENFDPSWWDGGGAWTSTIAGLAVGEVSVIGGHGAYWTCPPVFQLLGRTASRP